MPVLPVSQLCCNLCPDVIAYNSKAKLLQEWNPFSAQSHGREGSGLFPTVECKSFSKSNCVLCLCAPCLVSPGGRQTRQSWYVLFAGGCGDSDPARPCFRSTLSYHFVIIWVSLSYCSLLLKPHHELWADVWQEKNWTLWNHGGESYCNLCVL